MTERHAACTKRAFGSIKRLKQFGHENGLIAYEEYTELQSVIVNLFDAPFDWYADDGREKRYS